MTDEQVCLMYPIRGVLQCPHCEHEFDIEKRPVHKDRHLPTEVFYSCLWCGKDILVSHLTKECNG